jgi:NAD-dependent deacetylase
VTAAAASLQRAAELLRATHSAIAFTGAGISTASGIPDFRSPGSGLWENCNPLEVASLTAFRHHPERFYEWVRPLAAAIYRAVPNPAHRALAALEAAGHLRTVITQNIDALHQRAGSRRVLEIHGTLRMATCRECRRVFEAERSLLEFIHDGVIPLCSECGGVLKPNVILFEEQLPVVVFHQAREAAHQCGLVLVLGSSLEVMPAAGLPLEAVHQGARLVIINNEPTYLDERADVVIHSDVAQVLPELACLVGAQIYGEDTRD